MTILNHMLFIAVILGSSIWLTIPLSKTLPAEQRLRYIIGREIACFFCIHPAPIVIIKVMTALYESEPAKAILNPHWHLVDIPLACLTVVLALTPAALWLRIIARDSAANSKNKSTANTPSA